MRREIFEPLVACRRDRRTDGRHRHACERHRHALQNVNHAEHAVGRNAVDQVIRVAHHDLAWQSRNAPAHFFDVSAQCLDVFQNPQLMAAFFFDIFEQRGLVDVIIHAAAAGR